VARSLPHSENERQWSVNNFWRSMMVNHNARWQLMAIYTVLTSFIGYNVHNH
jgi:hypothetical protein